jgi:hypothetical protein
MTTKQAKKYAINNFRSANKTKTLIPIILDNSKAVSAASCLGDKFFSLNIYLLSPMDLTKLAFSY